MPYYLYRVRTNPILQLAKLEQYDSFREASSRAKILRRDMALADNSQVKVIFAENELAAEDMLSQVREPAPELGDD